MHSLAFAHDRHSPAPMRSTRREATRLVCDLFSDATGMLGGPVFTAPRAGDAEGYAFTDLLIALDRVPPVGIRSAVRNATAATGRVSVLRAFPPIA